MADTGAPWVVPYGTLANQPNGPQQQQDMAEAVHAGLGHAYPCLSTARPTHSASLIIYETDTERLYVSDGTEWIALAYGDDTGWLDAIAEGVTAASASFTLQSGFVKRCNGVAALNLTFTTVNAISAGDISNLNLATMPAGYVPGISSGSIGTSGAGPAWQGYVSAGGLLTMAATASAMSAGQTFSAIGTYLL